MAGLVRADAVASHGDHGGEAFAVVNAPFELGERTKQLARTHWLDTLLANIKTAIAATYKAVLERGMPSTVAARAGGDRMMIDGSPHPPRRESERARR